MRRGDACMRWATQEGDSRLRTRTGGRPCYPAAMYANATRRLVAAYGHGFGHGFGQGTGGAARRYTVLVASDAAGAAAELAQALSDDRASVRQLTFDRIGVGGVEGVNLGHQVDRGTTYIEHRLRDGDPSLDRSLVLASLHAELSLLSSADAFVGTSLSYVSRLLWMLMVGRTNAVPPFVLLDAPLGWVLGPAGRLNPSACKAAPSLRAPTRAASPTHEASSSSRRLAARSPTKMAASLASVGRGATRTATPKRVQQAPPPARASASAPASTSASAQPSPSSSCQQVELHPIFIASAHAASHATAPHIASHAATHTHAASHAASQTTTPPSSVHVTAESSLARAALRNCVLGVTFGCVDQDSFPPRVWVSDGCRARFVCNGEAAAAASPSPAWS